MKAQPLTPTHSRSHAPAQHLRQAKASLKSLLSEKDLESLSGDEERPQWSASGPQKNSDSDRFLASLDIRVWDIDQFIGMLRANLRQAVWPKPNPDFLNWLSAKRLGWHQRLYSLLHTEISLHPRYREDLEDVRLVRLVSGKYSVANECFFPTGRLDRDDPFPRVDARIYTSGKHRSRREHAKAFLEEIGVRVVDEAVHVEKILQQRGQYGDDELTCQVCKLRMPFKLDNGHYYFEKVEFLRELKRHHFQNYLALCPNCAAMFQHANGSSGLRDAFLELEGNELGVVLAQQNTTIRFTFTHIVDLKALIEADGDHLEDSAE
jgi:hypothetical protein